MNLKQAQLRRLLAKSFPEIVDFFDKVNAHFELQENAKSFWSEIYVVHLEPKDSAVELNIPESVFIKIPKLTDNVLATEDEGAIEDLMDTMSFYVKKENIFYKHFNEARIPYFPIPKVFYTEDIGADEATGGLVAENLMGKVWACEFLPGFDDEQVLRLMRSLAGFHWFTQTKKDHSFIKEFQDEVYSDNFQNSMVNKMRKSQENDVQLQFVAVKNLEAYDSTLFDNDRIQKLAWCFDYDYMCKVFSKAIQRYPRVLVHSDLNVTNVLWNKETEGDELRAIIDFQMNHEGSIAHDIIRILTLGISRKSRLENTDRYLKHYHDTLTTLYHGDAVPYTLEQLKIEYSNVFPIASNFTLFGISVYYKMYEDGTIGTKETCEANCRELLDRADGIIEEIERLGGPNHLV